MDINDLRFLQRIEDNDRKLKGAFKDFTRARIHVGKLCTKYGSVNVSALIDKFIARGWLKANPNRTPIEHQRRGYSEPNKGDWELLQLVVDHKGVRKASNGSGVSYGKFNYALRKIEGFYGVMGVKAAVEKAREDGHVSGYLDGPHGLTQKDIELVQGLIDGDRSIPLHNRIHKNYPHLPLLRIRQKLGVGANIDVIEQGLREGWLRYRRANESTESKVLEHTM